MRAGGGHPIEATPSRPQPALVVRRREDITRLEQELSDKRDALRARLAELERAGALAAD